ncbi:MAG: c-type cytochrome [Gemmatimonadota bacterium]|nr:MAG: c-type cytochrome [Gemmatimonadota bacterium]
MSARRQMPALCALAGLAFAAGLAGCRGTEIEDAIGNVDWFSNMRDQTALEPFEEPARLPPEGTVHVDAGVPLMALPDGYDEVTNPTAATPESLALGKEKYDIYCAVCHGPEGRGGGSIEGPYPRGLINRLDSQRARELSDGYIFGMISAGRGLMPNYRRMPQADRWHIVNYVRELQESAEDNQ